MTIASEITRINSNISAAYTAADAKGATLPATQNSGNLATCIASIPSGSSPVISSLSVKPTTSAQTITAPSGADGYSPINVSAVTSSIDANITAGNIKSGVTILGVTGTYSGSAGGSGTRDVPLTRVTDDNNNEIGTWYMNFVDGSGNEYKVVVLDAQYRNDSTKWCSNTNAVTNMPLYSDLKTSNVWEAKETATQNTQLILDYCTANSYTSTSCSHCRSQSFTIDGVTYYGQLPNMIEVIHLAKHYNEFDILDTSASSNSSTNFSSSHEIWSSSQSNSATGWHLTTSCSINGTLKTNDNFACPVLEIPVSNS